jgi:hypothetical protein
MLTWYVWWLYHELSNRYNKVPYFKAVLMLPLSVTKYRFFLWLFMPGRIILMFLLWVKLNVAMNVQWWDLRWPLEIRTWAQTAPNWHDYQQMFGYVTKITAIKIEHVWFIKSCYWILWCVLILKRFIHKGKCSHSQHKLVISVLLKVNGWNNICLVHYLKLVIS